MTSSTTRLFTPIAPAGVTSFSIEVTGNVRIRIRQERLVSRAGPWTNAGIWSIFPRFGLLEQSFIMALAEPDQTNDVVGLADVVEATQQELGGALTSVSPTTDSILTS